MSASCQQLRSKLVICRPTRRRKIGFVMRFVGPCRTQSDGRASSTSWGSLVRAQCRPSINPLETASFLLFGGLDGVEFALASSQNGHARPVDAAGYAGSTVKIARRSCSPSSTCGKSSFATTRNCSPRESEHRRRSSHAERCRFGPCLRMGPLPVRLMVLPAGTA